MNKIYPIIITLILGTCCMACTNKSSRETPNIKQEPDTTWARFDVEMYYKKDGTTILNRQFTEGSDTQGCDAEVFEYDSTFVACQELYEKTKQDYDSVVIYEIFEEYPGCSFEKSFDFISDEECKAFLLQGKSPKSCNIHIASKTVK